MLPELLDDDLELEDLLLSRDAKAGSDTITAPSIMISTNFCLNPACFIIKPRTNYIL